MGQGRHCGERGSTGGEASNIFTLGEDCMHTKHFSPVKHFSPRPAYQSKQVLFPSGIWATFLQGNKWRGSKQSNVSSSVSAQLWVGVARRGSLTWGHISRDVCSPPGGFSYMLGFSPHKGSTCHSLCTKKGETGRSTGKRGERMGTRTKVPLIPTHGESYSVHHSEKWHEMASWHFFNPFFFPCMCNWNNSYIHQQSINTIHPDVLWLHFQETEEGHSFIFHRDNNARWCLALSKRYNLGVRVCGPGCQSIRMDPFPLQMGIKTEMPLLTLVLYIYIYIFFLPTHCLLGFFSFSKRN